MDSERICVKKIAIARDSYALLYNDGNVIMYDLHSGKSTRLNRLDGVIDIAAGFDHYAGLTEYRTVYTDGECKNDSFAKSSYRFSDWHDGKAIYACEFHLALLQNDGTVRCAEGYGWDATSYKDHIEKWTGIKQLALTFERPFGLTEQGKVISNDSIIVNYFNNESEYEIIQIAAFGCYYSTHVFAALYADGTVRARILWNDEIKEVKKWQGVKKISCSICGAVGALRNDDILLIDTDRPYVDESGKEIWRLEDIRDFEMGFLSLVAVTKKGEIIVLNQKM